MQKWDRSQLLNSLDLEQTKRLYDYGRALSTSSPKDYKPMFDNKAWQSILPYLVDAEQSTSVLDYLNNLEDSNGVRFGRNYKDYEQMKATLTEEFGKEHAPDFRWNRSFRQAVEIVKGRYRKARLKPLMYKSNEDIRGAVVVKDTSSGYERILSGRTHKKDILQLDNLYSLYVQKEQQAIKDGSFNMPILVAYRSQCSDGILDNGELSGSCKHKTRPVWMVDIWTSIAGFKFSRPLSEFLRYYEYTAIGKDDKWLSRYINNKRARINSFKTITLDYSKYDTSLPWWLILEVFEVIKAAFAEFSPQDERLFEVIIEDFIYKNVVLDNAEIYYVKNGVPSGHPLTGIVDTIGGELITETIKIQYNLPIYAYNIMGDDNLSFHGYHETKLEDIAAYIFRNFGITVNVDKSSERPIKEAPEYLSRIWKVEGPYRHPNQLLSKLLFPERFRNYKLEGCSPELVVYSYILGYEAGMRQLIDVNGYLRDKHISADLLNMTYERTRELPYNVQLALGLAS